LGDSGSRRGLTNQGRSKEIEQNITERREKRSMKTAKNTEQLAAYAITTLTDHWLVDHPFTSELVYFLKKVHRFLLHT
jgi:hypothetical protein